MNRLMKAEWYRIRHSSHLFIWMIFICIVIAIIPIVSDIEFYEKSLSENFKLYSGAGYIFIPLFIGVMISISIGINYYNKTAYYEIMGGQSISGIIFSKVVVNSSVMTIGIIITCSIYFSIIYIMNGVGEYENILLRLILFVLIIIHVCIVSGLLSMCLRHIIGAFLIVFRFSILEAIFAQNSSMDKILNWFLSGQYQRILVGEITTKLIIAIILSTFLETIILYFISYYTMKKRKNLL